MNEQTNQSDYILLFHGKEWYNDLSPEELKKAMGQFKAWYDGLAERGKIKDGKPLGRSGALISGKNGRTVSDGPFAESKEAIGGFMLLNAGSLEEAIAVAKSNPGLAYGTTIEVRPVVAECPLSTLARHQEEEQLANA